MQVPMKQPKKGGGAGKALLSLLLALVLGAGGYFGVTMLLTGETPIDMFSGSDDDYMPQSDIPTNANGDNLIGNSMQNLHAGGLMTMQGEDLFYANPADGGALYCCDRTGKITKLTDFAVANLNVRGEMMVFTDLDTCAILREGGETLTLSATTHEELWEKAGESDHIRYGGRLYFMEGIKSFCAGKLDYEELVIAGVEGEERYQAPIFMETGEILLVVATPDSGLTPTAAAASAPTVMPLAARGGRPAVSTVKAAAVAYTYDSVMIVKPGEAMNRVSFDASKGDVIQNAVATTNNVFVETLNITDHSRIGSTITMLYSGTGKPMATISGHTAKSDGENLYFINNGFIYKWSPRTQKTTQVSRTPCDSLDYEIRPDGTIAYESVDPTTKERTMVPMYATLQENGVYKNSVGKGKLPFEFEFSRKRAQIFGGSYYGWVVEKQTWIREDRNTTYEEIDAKTGKLRTKRSRSEREDMPWSRQSREQGKNPVRWATLADLEGLFSNGNKPPASSGSSSSSSSAPSSSSGAPSSPSGSSGSSGSSSSAPSSSPGSSGSSSGASGSPSPPPSQSGSGGLSGSYVSEDNSRHTLTFNSNGTVDLFYSGASITFDYSVSGSTITFTPQGAQTGVYATVVSLFQSGVIHADGSIEVDNEIYR